MTDPENLEPTPNAPASQDPLKEAEPTSANAVPSGGSRVRPTWLTTTNVVGAAVIIVLLTTTVVFLGTWLGARTQSDQRAERIAKLSSQLAAEKKAHAACKSSALDLGQAAESDLDAIQSLRTATLDAIDGLYFAASSYVNEATSSINSGTAYAQQAAATGCH